MAKNVIELNGLRYDALTGKPVSSSAPKVNLPTSNNAAIKNLDGFTRRRPIQPSKTVSHAVHKKTQKSQTLMRTVVKKPAATKIHAKATAPTAVRQTQPSAPLVTSQKPGRVIRAGIINQSELISKFGKSTPTIKSAVINVTPAPVHALTPSQPTKLQTSTSTGPKPSPSHRPSVKTDTFHDAIQQATSHDLPRIKKPSLKHKIAKKLHVSPRVVSYAGSSFAILAIVGVVAYQNMPEFAMKVAATRAGLNASLPSYQPAGFALAGPIKYDHGEVTINYKSNSDERAFDVTQKNSSWNSETLLENYVAATNQPYQTFQANGRTIYIYEGNKATWVDGGVWFNIDGKTNLNSDQLLRIADSL